MSTSDLMKRLLAAAAVLLSLAIPAEALELKSYKDTLFAYPGILDQADNGAYIKVDYREKRDINQRDEIPERRVKGAYVSLGVRWKQDFETLQADGRPVDVFRAGKLEGARFAVIFIHGRGGDRKLGANDFSFGGNFNRLKNLAVDNQGVYFAPTASDFDAKGPADVGALISYIHKTAPKAKVVLSCASMGTFICWKLAGDAAVVAQLQGMMIMGGPSDPKFLQSAAYAARLPLFFSHGSADIVYKSTDQLALYKSLHGKGYPARFVLFETGTHGTPVRMTDWRDSLDWIFAQRP